MSLIAAVVTSTILAGAALWKNALTMPGTVLAWFLCIVITAAGGTEAFLILAATFVLTAAAGKAAGQKSDPLHVRRRTGTRDAASVLCNIGMGTFAMMCMIVSGKDLFLLVYTAVMAESLADSLASKIGPLSKAVLRVLCLTAYLDRAYRQSLYAQDAERSQKKRRIAA